MTVDRQKGKIVFVCDGCGDGATTDTDDWEEARAVLRQEEWATAKDGDTWKHFCADCKGNTRLRPTP
jgi:hypothetical protein